MAEKFAIVTTMIVALLSLSSLTFPLVYTQSGGIATPSANEYSTNKVTNPRPGIDLEGPLWNHDNIRVHTLLLIQTRNPNPANI